MKVTVCFGSVRVVVPCGNGDILIGDLIEEAVIRYKKATGKPSSAWVTVHNLKSVNDGGILDPDDRLRDVADDREQILAIFEEQASNPYFIRHQSVLNHHHNGGDGSSGSSTNCETPDLVFHVDVDGVPPDGQGGPADCHSTDVEISGDGLPSGVSVLQVRRGSEPALNKILPLHPSSYLDPMKRWSTAIVLDGSNSKRSSERGKKGHHSDGDFLSDREDGSGGEDRSSFSHFSRDSTRSSVLCNSDEGPPHHMTMPRNRREPLGGPKDNEQATDVFLIVIQNDGSPLGIHVVPECDTSERDFGLVVQSVDPGGKIEKDGRIGVNDRIIEINGKSVLNVNFHRAQDMFKTALYASEIRLRVQKFGGSKLETGIRSLAPAFPPLPEKNYEQSDAVHAEHSASENTLEKLVSVSPPSRKPAAAASHHNHHQYMHNANAMLSSNTRKIGKKYPIQLTKGHHGLGFSITTRDNLSGVNCPIYVKNILPKGAAIEDGRLRPGDRLLEVNSVQMTGKSQDDAVSLLRNAPLGSSVSLVVSRQEPESPKLPRKIPLQSVERTPSNDGHYFPWRQREILTFDIPLNDTGSAGLGVSVKGKTSTGPHGTTDLGIFVKSVIHGGAASKDGRLNENDQLININGVSLLCMPNSHAMETLRRVMHQEGPNPGAITLSVSRRLHLQSQLTNPENKQKWHASGHRIESYSGSQSSRVSTANSSNSNSDRDRERERSSRTPSSMGSTTDSERTAIFRPYGAGGGSGSSGRGGGRDEERNLDHEDDVTKIEDKDLGLDCPSDSYNPVVERITGLRAPRNESYYHACCDGWNSPQPQQQQQHSGGNYNDTVLIEDESNPAIRHSHPQVPRSTNQQQHSKEMADVSKLDQATNVGKEGVLSAQSADPNATFASQMSLDEDSANFDRDGFGRQSMSEKRNAQLDARSTDTYQRNKKARELAKEKERQQPQLLQPPQYPDAATSRRLVRYPPNYSAGDHIFGYVTDGSTSNLVRCNSADSIISGTHRQKLPSKSHHAIPPTMLTVKSNSLESVQRAGQSGDKSGNDGDPDEIYGQRKDGGGGSTAIRNRGCNESFRAAVDRSYDAPLGSADAMETLDEEAESGVPSRVVGRAYSVCATLPPPEHLDDAERCNKKNKKRGILRNLGQVFKFGKANKKGSDMTANGRFGFIDTDFHKVDAEMVPVKHAERDVDRFHELKKSEDHSRFAIGGGGGSVSGDQQQQYSQRPTFSSNSAGLNYEEGGGAWQGGTNAGKSSSSSLQDRMSNLRTQHQRKHQERQGQYPMDDQEERLQRKTLEKVRERQCYESEKVEVIHSRSHSYDTCTDNRQTSSRPSGNVVYASNKYGHYVNYEEIQQHIRRRDDQAPIRPVPVAASAARDRPMSNYYEYESINRNSYKMNPSSSRQMIAPPDGLHHLHQQQQQNQFATNHGSLRGNPPIMKKKQTSSGKHSSVHPSNTNINNNNNNNNNKKVHLNVISSSRDNVPASKV